MPSSSRTAPSALPTQQSSLIEESGKTSSEWLIAALPCPWFGEVILKWDPSTRDLWPITIDWYNRPTQGVS